MMKTIFQHGQFTCWDEHQFRPLNTVLSTDTSPQLILLGMADFKWLMEINGDDLIVH